MNTVRVAVIGAGEIGHTVAAALSNDEIEGASLGAVIRRHHDANATWPHMRLEAALQQCDIFVECAGQQALIEHGPGIVAASRTLVATSVGAVLDPRLRAGLEAGPGRWVCTSGAIGGLDILSAARGCAHFETVSLVTTKHPRALEQAWMSHEQKEELRALTTSRDLFEGDAREAGRWFPSSMNVASALALATGTPNVKVTVRADSRASRTRHEIHATHELGEYRFAIDNAASDARPSTSAVTAHSVRRTLQLLIDPSASVL